MKQHLFLISALLLLSSCDTSGGEQGGFLAQPGPILFVSDESGTSQLYSMEPDGSDVRKLTNDPTAPVSDGVWSPDGGKVALVVDEGGDGPYRRNGIYIVNADGTGRYRLTGSGGKFMNVQHPIWSPDGERIAFTAQLPPEPLGWFELFVIGTDGSGLRQIGPPEALLPKRIDDWSADGERLLGWVRDSRVQNAQGQHVENGTVITFNLDGAILDTLMQTGGAPEYAEPYSLPQAPLWSPDEDRLAFSNRLNYTTTRDGLPFRTVQEDVYVAHADGTGPAPLTRQEYHQIWPVAWSLDGASILARALNLFPNPRPYDPTYTEHVVMVQADGSGLKEITPFPEAYSEPTSWRR